MTNKGTIQQVLGSLMKHPQFLSEIDKYSLSMTDFSTKFEKYIFTAIQGLWQNGAPKITAFDIENYLEANAAAKKLFEQQNGLEYLQDIEEFSNVENFPYYYTKLKKLNLLRDLKKQNFPVDEFYQEDLTAPNAAEINQQFEDLTVSDIITAVKKRLLVLESDFVGIPAGNTVKQKKFKNGIFRMMLMNSSKVLDKTEASVCQFKERFLIK